MNTRAAGLIQSAPINLLSHDMDILFGLYLVGTYPPGFDVNNVVPIGGMSGVAFNVRCTEQSIMFTLK
jgi:hypothetical protein